MKDPYQILGISPNASDDEVKRAYRELAKKYHPDAYADNPLADLAAEKMKEINEAYDTITKQRASGGRSGGSYSRAGGSGTGSTGFGRIRELISANRITEAETMLSRVLEGDRNAEWYYLMGHVMKRKNWIGEARRYFEQACMMDPYNAEYRGALNELSSYGNNAYSNTGRADDCNMCDVFTGVCCANLLCDCCNCCR